jgi:hypothetical protein
MVFNATFQQYFSSIVVVSFIGGGNRSTRRKPPSYRKSLTNFMQIYHAWEGFLGKILVERRKISRAERRGKFILKTGIFRIYPFHT